jgi:hypothetical protein
MHFGTNRKADLGAVPLQGAVLCVNCECVTDSRFDECLVCGSRSLFSLARMLGGTQLSSTATRSNRGENIALLDVEISVNLKQIEPRDLNAAIESITNLIGPTLGQGRACFHIKVEPVLSSYNSDVVRAA